MAADNPAASAAAAAVTGSADAPAHAANMLIPQAYDVAWTSLRQPFNVAPSPGELTTPASTAAQGSAGATAGTSSGAILPANPLRACLILQNNSATGGPVLWFNFGQPAVASSAGSFALQPGGSLVIAEPKACPKESLYVAWSGAGTALGAYYQNSLPEKTAPTSSSQGWKDNLGAIAWGYAPAPAPAPAPAAPRPFAIAAKYIP
ncbi:MAG: hypothetical protein ACREJ2_11700 [Planctomycetota bacterium]